MADDLHFKKLLVSRDVYHLHYQELEDEQIEYLYQFIALHELIQQANEEYMDAARAS